MFNYVSAISNLDEPFAPREFIKTENKQPDGQ